ncbi:MAG: hypothetical protein PWP14_1916 [Methanolobus sp.]|nr:hypothetical protein [Methanolobus sp.]
MANLKKTCMLTVVLLMVMSALASAHEMDDESHIMVSGSMENTTRIFPTIVKTLYAGQHIEVGTVTVSSDIDNLTIKYETTDNWTLKNTSLHVATSYENIPKTKSHNPIPGQFDYKSENLPCGTTNLTYVVPISNENITLFIAAHADVSKTNDKEAGKKDRDKENKKDEGDNEDKGNEGAWAEGTAFSGNNWATYFTYDIAELCEDDGKGGDNGGEGDDNEGEDGDDSEGEDGDDNEGEDGDDNEGEDGDDNEGEGGDDNEGEGGDDNEGEDGDDNGVEEGNDNEGEEGDDTEGEEGDGNEGEDEGGNEGEDGDDSEGESEADTGTKKSGSSSGSGRMVASSPVTTTDDDNAYMSADIGEEEQPPMVSTQEPVYEDEGQGTMATIMEKGGNFLWIIIALLLSGIWIMSGYGLTFH